MKRFIRRSVYMIIFACILLILMCAIFIENADAASTIKGTAAKKEVTVKVKLNAGVSVVSLRGVNGWVFAQLQTAGKDVKGSPIGGVSDVAEKGKTAKFVVPITTKGTYYLYMYGVKKGSKYSIKQIKAGGELKSGKTVKRTSFADNSSVVYYTIKVPSKGKLAVKVKDASYMYPGYSKVRLLKGEKTLSEEEHLIDALGYQTSYGVTKGTYKIGVRSSSELYSIKATFRKVDCKPGGREQSKAVKIAKGKAVKNIVTPGNETERWYKIVFPAKEKGKSKYKINLKGSNSNVDIYGGLRVLVMYDVKKSGTVTTETKEFILNNNSTSLKLKASKGKKRTIYLKAAGYKKASGVYQISWK